MYDHSQVKWKILITSQQDMSSSQSITWLVKYSVGCRRNELSDFDKGQIDTSRMVSESTMFVCCNGENLPTVCEENTRLIDERRHQTLLHPVQANRSFTGAQVKLNINDGYYGRNGSLRKTRNLICDTFMCKINSNYL